MLEKWLIEFRNTYLGSGDLGEFLGVFVFIVVVAFLAFLIVFSCMGIWTLSERAIAATKNKLESARVDRRRIRNGLDRHDMYRVWTTRGERWAFNIGGCLVVHTRKDTKRYKRGPYWAALAMYGKTVSEEHSDIRWVPLDDIKLKLGASGSIIKE